LIVNRALVAKSCFVKPCFVEPYVVAGEAIVRGCLLVRLLLLCFGYGRVNSSWKVVVLLTVVHLRNTSSRRHSSNFVKVAFVGTLLHNVYNNGRLEIP
jgi:hypothetical protein